MSPGVTIQTAQCPRCEQTPGVILDTLIGHPGAPRLTVTCPLCRGRTVVRCVCPPGRMSHIHVPECPLVGVRAR